MYTTTTTTCKRKENAGQRLQSRRVDIDGRGRMKGDRLGVNRQMKDVKPHVKGKSWRPRNVRRNRE
jgi:hypothetical protein